MDRKEYSKKYRDLNKEEIKEYKRKWYQENEEKLKLKAKKYYKENKENILKKRKIYLLEKYGDDMNFQIKKNVYNYIAEGIRTGYWKNEIEELLGYSVSTLEKHLLDKEAEMGKIDEYWHIHHIIPVRVYNFYNKEDIKKCWNLENLITLPNSKRNNDIDWDKIEEKKIEYLLPDTLMVNDLTGRHHEIQHNG